MTKQVNTNLLKVGDFFLIAFIIIGTAAYMYSTILLNSNSDSKLTAVIIKDNHLVKTIDLRKKDLNEIIDLKDEYNIKISAEYGRIRFSHASCPDKLCLAAGWLTKPGDTAICMPDKTILKIIRNDSSVDAVSY